MEYNKVFEYIGQSGFYQIGIILLLGVSWLLSGFYNIASNFYAFPQEHWCHVARLESYPHDWQKYVAIPYVEGSEDEYESCVVYDLDYANLTDDVIRSWNRSHMISDDTPTRDCDGWVFDQSEYISTIQSEVS